MTRTIGGVQPGTFTPVECVTCHTTVDIPAGCILRCPGEEQRKRVNYCHAIVDATTGIILRKGPYV